MSSTSTDSAGRAKTEAGADSGATFTPNAAAVEPPDTGRPTPPDVIGGPSIHRPGQAPGMSVLDGPATMTVGAHRKKSSGKKKN